MPGWIRNSLTLKIFIGLCALLLVSCAVIYGAVAFVMPRSYRFQIRRDLASQLSALSEELSATAVQDSAPLLDTFMIRNGVAVSVYDNNGDRVDLPSNILLAGGAEEKKYVLEAVEAETAELDWEEDTVVTSYSINVDEDSAVLGSLVAFEGEAAPYTLLVDTGSVERIDEVSEALVRLLPLMAGLVLLVSLSGAFFSSRIITRPIVRISRTAKRMSEMDLSVRCNGVRKDEIGDLSRSLDLLAENLSASLQGVQDANEALQQEISRQRDFFSAASHELKTPLTVIKGQLEGMLYNVGIYQDRDRYLRRSLEVIGSMEELVRDLLSVARMETAGFRCALEPVGLPELLRECVREIMPLSEKRGVTVRTDFRCGGTVSADRKLLKRAFSNLVGNAVLHSAQGAQVSLRLVLEENRIAARIENSGAHIPEDALPHLFEAFYRVEKSRNRRSGGSGLGLYIVKSILENHHFGYWIENTDGGVLFTVTIPVGTGENHPTSGLGLSMEPV